MDQEFSWIEGEEKLPRCYIAVATLNNFRGNSNVEAHIFRTGATDDEVADLLGKGFVKPADPCVPKEILAGSTEELAVRCILEAFTKEEALALAEYLESRYSGQISRLEICPLDLPAPFGVAPLASIPESEKSGFINFDKAPDYNLPFTFKGYYDLSE